MENWGGGVGAYQAVSKRIEERAPVCLYDWKDLPSNKYPTGHSLGGALATLAAHEFVQRSPKNPLITYTV